MQRVGAGWKPFAAQDRPAQALRKKSDSGADFDWSAVRNGLPELIHFGIGDGDATVGPVDPAMEAAKPRKTVGEAVNHDFASRFDAIAVSVRDVLGIRV